MIIGNVHGLRSINDKALRSLRVWHWQKALWASRQMSQNSASNRAADQLYKEHMHAVQTMNDLFPVGDTAEKDAQIPALCNWPL